MSLVWFHRFLILAAILNLALYGLWEYRTNVPGGGAWAGIRCAAAAGAAICLAIYLRHFIARTRRGA